MLFRVMLRWITLLFLMTVASLLIARGLGELLNPYPPFMLQDFQRVGSNQSRMIYTDVITQVQYQPAPTNTDYRVSHTINLGYRTERVDDFTHIYTKRTWQNSEQLVAIVPRESRNIQTSWTFDYDDPFYIVDVMRSQDDTVAIYAVDMNTGDYTLHGTYPFIGSPDNTYLYDSTYFYLQRFGSYFTLINMETGESFSQRAQMSRFNFGSDNEYFFYSVLTEVHDEDNESNRVEMMPEYFIRDLETQEETQVILPDAERTIAQFYYWTPSMIMDDQDHLWFYDIENDSYTPLPEDYRQIGGGYTWASDGERLVLMKLIDDMTVDFGIYNMQTEDFLPFLTVDEQSAQITVNRFYSVQWSYDDKYLIFVDHDFSSSHQFDIYDGRTGDFLFDHTRITDLEADYISWGYYIP